MTSAPALVRPALTPPNDRRAPILERVRVPAPEPDGEPRDEPCAAAARCAPSFAMTLEREMRGLRAMSCFGFGGSTAGRGIFDGELMIVAAAAVSDGWPYAGDAGDSEPGRGGEGEDPKLVSGWLKIRVGRGESGLWPRLWGCWLLELRGDMTVALDEEAAWAALVRFGLKASATGGRPEVRPVDCRTVAFAFASELAVGARREEGRFRRGGWSFVSGDLASGLELVEASVLVLDVLRRVPIEETTVVPDVTLVLVPMDDAALVPLLV